MTITPLADAALKATVLLVGALLAVRVLNRGSAATRHLVWTCVLAGALALPALSMALPRWHLPLVTVAAPPAPAMDATAPAGALPSASAALAPAAPVESAREPLDATGAMLLFWAVGAALVLARMFAGIASVYWLSRRSERVTAAPWLPLARQAASDLGIARRVEYRRGAGKTMPMTWGVGRAVVLLPPAADTWPEARLRIVLLHELAHVKRHDCLTHLLAQAACALYWFNPLVWMASRRARIERERACDDLVLAAGTRGADYADELLHIARAMRGGPSAALLTGATLAMARRSQLEGRLLAILDPSLRRAVPSRPRAAGATALFACALLPLAGLQPSGHGAAVFELAQPRETAQQPAADPHIKKGTKLKTSPKIKAVTKTTVDAGREIGVTEKTKVKVKPKGTIEIDGRDIADAVNGAIEGALEGAIEGTIEGMAAVMDEQAVRALIEALKDADVDVRAEAAYALGEFGDRRAIEALTKSLQDASDIVREHAAYALGRLAKEKKRNR